MTAKETLTGASSTNQAFLNWKSIPGKEMQKQVFRLQVRIAQAERTGRRGRVKALQRILTTSFAAKYLAVRRITRSPGGKTPGIDKVTWGTDLQKMKAIFKLKGKGYTPQPLRRIYIPKKFGTKQRPLSIPTLKDRAMQALYLLALEPLVEERADPNAYGFRQKRSAHDAIDQCFKVLGKKKSAAWILEGDIKDCFAQINHDWLMRHIPMDKKILKKFLKAGFMEKGQLYPTQQGTAQGGPISPALTVMALSGLEQQLTSSTKRQRSREKINMIAYADDFIVTATSEELLKTKVKPILSNALAEVGLELSEKKTQLTFIHQGFEFLGFSIRKYRNGKLLIKPSKASINGFLKEIKTMIKKGRAMSTEKLIYTLNEKITGWTNYYRTVVASKVFSFIDHHLFLALKRWGFKRHSRKSKRWIINHYFKQYRGDHWRFYCRIKDKEGKTKYLYLKRAKDTKIRRHLKIKAKANPFDPFYRQYFEKREQEQRKRSLLSHKTELAGLRVIQPY